MADIKRKTKSEKVKVSQAEFFALGLKQNLGVAAPATED
jgi:hypothetical protein